MPLIGAMIELPAAAILIDKLLPELDFICIGTNDLVQYTIGIDRDNDLVADIYRSLHPAVLQLLSRVLVTSSSVGKQAIVCGEMAGSPFYLPLLLGLGAKTLSMKPRSLTNAMKAISQIDLVKCNELAELSLKMSTADEVEDLLRKQILSEWPHLINFIPK